MKALTIALAAMLAGCTSSDPLSEACGGTRPMLQACVNGLVHSECGGEGETVLACNDHAGECRWFVGGCVAVGFRPIDCAIDDVCCVATADGEWPYEGEWTPMEDWAVRELVEDIAFVGPEPVSGTSPSTVAVTIDPSVSTTEPMVECDGIDLRSCPIGPSPGRAIRTHDSVVLVFRPTDLGDELYVEIVEQEDRTFVGRAFTRYLNDYHPETPLSCDAAQTRHVPLSGTLVIDRVGEYPVETHGVLELTDPAGGTIRISF